MMHDGRDGVKPIRVVLHNFYVSITRTHRLRLAV
jgi:hypothetical protein